MLPVYLTEFRKLDDVPVKTVNRMVQAALQQQQINPVTLPTLERLPLTTEVIFSNGFEGVIVNHNPTDSQRYEVAWFDRHFWTVRRRWMSRSQFTVADQKQTAEAVAGSAVA